MIRSRELLVRTRANLVNHVRGAVKPFGVRFARCSPESFPRQVRERVPDALVPALAPILEAIASLTERIGGYARELEALSCWEFYPETALLRQVQGVGPLTALAFVLTVEDPSRFETSRSVGAYLGLVPGQHQSGDSDPQQRISKRGDEMTRRLSVSCAHYVLGPFAQDSDLRRHGLKIAERGGKRTPRTGRRSPWRGRSRCCCTACGRPGRPTNRSTTPTGRRRSGRGRKKPAKRGGVIADRQHRGVKRPGTVRHGLSVTARQSLAALPGEAVMQMAAPAPSEPHRAAGPRRRGRRDCEWKQGDGQRRHALGSSGRHVGRLTR